MAIYKCDTYPMNLQTVGISNFSKTIEVVPGAQTGIIEKTFSDTPPGEEYIGAGLYEVNAEVISGNSTITGIKILDVQPITDAQGYQITYLINCDNYVDETYVKITYSIWLAYLNDPGR